MFRPRAHRAGGRHVALGRRRRAAGAEVVRQESGAVERGQFRSAAAVSSARRRRLHRRPRRTHGVRPFRGALRRPDRGRRTTRPQCAGVELRPRADRSRHSRCTVPKRGLFLLRCDRQEPRRDRAWPVAEPPRRSRRLDIAAFLAEPEAAGRYRRAPHRRPGRRYRRPSGPGERRAAGVAGRGHRGLRAHLFQAQGRRRSRRPTSPG